MDEWTISHFSQSKLGGTSQRDVAGLLRLVPETLDGMGDVDVQDITFHTEVADNGDDLTVTVYYSRRAEDN